MFCINCGAKIRDNANFCDKCGAVIGNNSISVPNNYSHAVSNVNPYERDVVLLHLYDLRNLEFEREKLRVNWANLNYKINNLCIEYKYEQPSSPAGHAGEIVFTIIVGAIAVAVFLGLGGFLQSFLTSILPNSLISGLGDLLNGICILLAIASIVIAIVYMISVASESSGEKSEYYKECNLYKQNIKNQKIRIEQETPIRNNLIKIRAEVEKEWHAADDMLNKAYDVNLIPSQFRDIYAVYYLYEYLSTSRETLSEALLHLDLDAIKKKLDTIIQQNEDIIIELARTNARMDDLNKKNDKLIESAIAIEDNTMKAAQYAEIASIHAEAQSQILLAQYISQNF